jgi:hypothetical protein
MISPDYVDFAPPLPSLSLAAYTCSDDFETKFSPEAVKKRKLNYDIDFKDRQQQI